MKLNEWMVKPTPQTEWIQGRGILLWLAFFFIELGAGIFFVATFFGNLWAMLIGWLVCGVIGGGVHILYLGHPFRFWRMLRKPGSSWISRGLIFVSLFLTLGLIQMAVVSGGGSSLVLTVLVDIFAFLTIVYGGFAMNCVNGIPLWNTALLPILYAVSGIWGGASVALGIALGTGAVSTIGVSLEEWIRLLLIAYIGLIIVYFISVRYTNLTGKVSIQGIVSGEYWPLMWFGVVLIGLVIPIAVVVISLGTGIENMSAAVLYIAILCELVGDITMRYLILKDGLYSPLIASSAYAP
ncbi:MAG: dimethyl sulfoxide reductase anchor subunit [Dehalococcoidales bacterium]|mgnify:CR=1|jgi:formate-dependent nitrite reductase membrane component NrfD|nr:dimethyl sulfoxide reductase anchor subunit [Dehalococcoidales bacterium]|tara:strand:+ start:717 stop:1604 length:888 start_codon:yes stop_codon:yes gene_type:complete